MKNEQIWGTTIAIYEISLPAKSWQEAREQAKAIAPNAGFGQSRYHGQGNNSPLELVAYLRERTVWELFGCIPDGDVSWAG